MCFNNSLVLFNDVVLSLYFIIFIKSCLISQNILLSAIWMKNGLKTDNHFIKYFTFIEGNRSAQFVVCQNGHISKILIIGN